MATKIKIELLKAGISGADIARSVGVHRTMIYHVIVGRSKCLRIRRAIAHALGMKVSDLWPEDGHKRKAAA